MINHSYTEHSYFLGFLFCLQFLKFLIGVADIEMSAILSFTTSHLINSGRRAAHVRSAFLVAFRRYLCDSAQPGMEGDSVVDRDEVRQFFNLTSRSRYQRLEVLWGLRIPCF